MEILCQRKNFQQIVRLATMGKKSSQGNRRRNSQIAKYPPNEEIKFVFLKYLGFPPTQTHNSSIKLLKIAKLYNSPVQTNMTENNAGVSKKS